MGGGFDTRFRMFKAKNISADGSIEAGGVCVPDDGTDGSSSAWDGTFLLLRPTRNITGTAWFDGTDGSTEGSTIFRDRAGHLTWINVSGYTIPAAIADVDGTDGTTKFSAVCAVGNPQYLQTADTPFVGAHYGCLSGTQYLTRAPGQFICHARMDGTHGLFTEAPVNPYVGRVGVVQKLSSINGVLNVKLFHWQDGNEDGTSSTDATAVQDGTTFSIRYIP